YCEMAEKVVSVLFGQITAMSLIVTPTSGTLAEVDVGAAPQPRYQVSQAQAALTDDDLRAILVTSGMPYLFKNLCASFKPPLKLLPENIHKYVLAKLSDDPEAIDRIKRLGQDESDTLAKNWGEALLEKHKNDRDPVAGICNEIVQRVGPKGTDAPGLLVAVEDQPPAAENKSAPKQPNVSVPVPPTRPRQK
ncbi:MAG: hypothetical protein WBL96_19765, partial [Pseudolabrys sp.]